MLMVILISPRSANPILITANSGDLPVVMENALAYSLYGLALYKSFGKPRSEMIMYYCMVTLPQDTAKI